MMQRNGPSVLKANLTEQSAAERLLRRLPLTFLAHHCSKCLSDYHVALEAVWDPVEHESPCP